MSYFELLLEQDYTFYKKVMEFREVQCSYFTTEKSLKNNLKIIGKTFHHTLINKSNIKNSLFKLKNDEIEILKKIIEKNEISEDITDSIKYSGFFIIDENSKPIFHKNFLEIFKETIKVPKNQPIEKTNTDIIKADFIAYSLYVIVVNNINMGTVKCLANTKPGIRMFDSISAKISYKITKDFFQQFFDFLIASKLILNKEHDNCLFAKQKLESRKSFYTNYFKYIDAHLNEVWFKNLKSSYQSKFVNIIYRKDQLKINKKSFNFLLFSDFIKKIDENKFVLSELATQFLCEKVVSAIHTNKTFYILPGFKLLMERTIDENILSFIIKCASIENYDNVFNIQFNTKSLIKAKKNNINAVKILNFLKEYSFDIPNDLELMIKDSLDRYGEVKIFSKFNFLTTENPHIKEKILNIKELAKYVVYSNDYTIAIKKSKNPWDIKHLLISHNLIPEVIENKDYYAIKKEDIKETIIHLSNYKKIVKKDNSALFDEIEKLLDKLKTKASELVKEEYLNEKQICKSVINHENMEINSKKEMSLEHKMDLLNFAIGKKFSLKIFYKQKGTDIIEEREIVPKYLDGDFLIAYCKLRKGTRRFNIYTLTINSIQLN